MRLLLIILALFSTAYGQVKVTVTRAYTVTLGGVGSAPSCPFDVIFTRLDNLQQSPAGIWGPVTGNNGDGEATDSILADGYFQAEYNGTENRQTAICLGTGRNYDQPAYVYAEFVVYVDATTGTYRPIEIGSPYDTDSLALAGDEFRLNRIGSTVTIDLKRAGGSWVSIHTFTTTTDSPLYMYCSQGDSGSPVYLRNPKYCNE